ncbi:hypothetical protein SASPL_154968 [Salvia splendens]|uniref:Fucosyltransferase n=1 Tax=Salvia splendens TaxID=180675 RepID=A0A8X8YYX9_SALSN|nr:hypothetical protein SASPL_154968 [Salvia splendens]
MMTKTSFFSAIKIKHACRELHSLFPDKETVFHFLGRYLFHPTNTVWGLISRYYEAYLSKADVTMSQQEGGANSSIKQKKVSVLVTSLSSGYFEQIRDLYWENPTTTGEVVAVFQPSNERYQQSEKQNHNRKAWAEIYLLSLTDKLVTSSSSTFGCVAQGLGGVRPWILSETENQTAPDPPCRRVMSMEPCFHSPAFFDCKTKRGIDPGAVVPHVRHCEDRSWGLKLFQNHSK